MRGYMHSRSVVWTSAFASKLTPTGEAPARDQIEHPKAPHTKMLDMGLGICDQNNDRYDTCDSAGGIWIRGSEVLANAWVHARQIRRLDVSLREQAHSYR